MPRIDPERLLKTLAPLLEPASGAIKSNSEVDKIYGLMSKFSKKLVSKCTYINILKATQPEVLDLFLQRGGWDMVLGWTSDAASKNNYDLLKEITGLLLYAPTTIQRLKENELPKVVKSISKDCENEEIRDLAKQVVIKWIAVAKNQEFSLPAHLVVGPSNFSNNTSSSSSSTSHIGGALHPPPVPVQSCSITSTKPTTSTGIIGTESTPQTTTTGDLDISSFDISQAELNAMMEFNPDDFSKVCEQHLGLSEAVASGNAIVHSIDNSNVLVDSSDTIKINLNNDNMTPKLQINTMSGQHVQVHVNAAAAAANTTTTVGCVIDPLQTKQQQKEAAPLHCIMVKDGKPFLVRLKLAPPKEITELRNSQEEITSTSSCDTSTPPPLLLEKKKSNNKNSSESGGGTLKTYSKRNPVEVIPAIAQPPSDITSKSATTKSLDSSSSDTKKHRSSSNKGSSQAAVAAAKKAAEEEKLKEKIRQEKATLKKRAKEAAKAKQKQQDKDQETLKQLNLTMEPSVTTPPKDNKFHKIPKRQSSSFSDAIGIPGSTSSSQSSKTLKKKSSLESTSTRNDATTTQNHDSSNNKPLEEKGKESRRHRPKVFTKKSRGDDLLKDMTETTVKANSNNINSSSKSNKSESSFSNKSIESSLSGNSLIFKPEKRPSIDGIEKPGDSKKAKIMDSTSSDIKKTKELLISKQPQPKKPSAAQLTESNMFMQALDAIQPTKPASKKKRRLSSVTNEKDEKLIEKNNSIISQQLPTTSSSSASTEKQNNSHSPASAASDKKPVFNFYRETLDDGDQNQASTKVEGKVISPNSSMEEPMDIMSEEKNDTIIGSSSQIVGGTERRSNDDDDDNNSSNNNDDSDRSLTPVHYEQDHTPLKSVLVIHRSKNKVKKSVRWREEEELTEVHTFECDEDERVNVTKHKDFMSMKEHERAEEKEYVVNSLKHGILSDDGEEKMPWRRPLALHLDVVDPIIESKEKEKQEERERRNLGVFLPPGSLLPESGSEPDPASPSEDDQLTETRIIPMEDVMNITKVYDNRNLVWPRPKADSAFVHQQQYRFPVKPVISPTYHHHQHHNPQQQPFGLASNFGDIIGMQQQPPVRGFNNNSDFNNPWNNNSNTTVPIMGVPSNNNNAVNGFPMNTINIPSGPIGFPPPTIQQNNNPFGFPLPGMPINFTSVPPPVLGHVLQDNIVGIGGSGASTTSVAFNNNHHGSTNNNNLTSTRDYSSDRDLRRPSRGDSQRDGYDSRGRSRNDHRSSSSRDHHDRDRSRGDHHGSSSRRSPSPSSRRRGRDDRDGRDRQDKDYRDHDYRSRPSRSGGKKDVPCRFFAKGQCHSGSRCEFSHELGQASTTGDSSSRSASKNESSSSSRSTTTTSSSSSSSRRSPPAEEEDWETDVSNQFERRRGSSEVPLIDIADTPSSPTNDMIQDSSLQPAKIIPVE